jgi:simple sugar transport system permease protein
VDELLIGSLLASTLRVATPLLLCALAGVLSERAGVIDLGLEGKMLATAFAAASVGAVSGSLGLAMACAVAVGLGLSMLHGYACVSHRGDQVVMGVAITMTAAGLTVVLGIAWFHQGGQTPPLPDDVRLPRWFGGLADALQGVPLLGAVIGTGLFGHSALVYVAMILVGVVWWLLFRTRLGLRLRATGENPAMVDAAGVSVLGLRYLALAANGVLTGAGGLLPGAGAEPAVHPEHDRGPRLHGAGGDDLRQVAPVGAFLACLLFGFLDAVAIRLQGAALPGLLGGGAVPVQAIQALPYVLTVVLLAGFIGRAHAPKALGTPYVKER